MGIMKCLKKENQKLKSNASYVKVYHQNWFHEGSHPCIDLEWRKILCSPAPTSLWDLQFWIFIKAVAADSNQLGTSYPKFYSWLYWLLARTAKCPSANTNRSADVLEMSPGGVLLPPWVSLGFSQGPLNLMNGWTFWNCFPHRVERGTQFQTTTYRVDNNISDLGANKFKVKS
jgi:hypothetical protein